MRYVKAPFRLKQEFATQLHDDHSASDVHSMVQQQAYYDYNYIQHSTMQTPLSWFIYQYSNIQICFNYYHRIKGFDTYKAFFNVMSSLDGVQSEEFRQHSRPSLTPSRDDITLKEASVSNQKRCKCQSLLSCDNS